MAGSGVDVEKRRSSGSSAFAPAASKSNTSLLLSGVDEESWDLYLREYSLLFSPLYFPSLFHFLTNFLYHISTFFTFVYFHFLGAAQGSLKQ